MEFDIFSLNIIDCASPRRVEEKSTAKTIYVPVHFMHIVYYIARKVLRLHEQSLWPFRDPHTAHLIQAPRLRTSFCLARTCNFLSFPLPGDGDGGDGVVVVVVVDDDDDLEEEDQIDEFKAET